MAKKKTNQLTKEGLQELEKELEDRKGPIRKKLQDQLDEELKAGDLSENAGYYQIQEEIASNDKRIEELEELIKNAEVVEKNSCSTDECTVGIGNTVTIKNDGREVTYHIVGSTEADPSENKISIESPIGKSLANKKVGDAITVKTPMGKTEYDIIAVK